MLIIIDENVLVAEILEITKRKEISEKVIRNILRRETSKRVGVELFFKLMVIHTILSDKHFDKIATMTKPKKKRSRLFRS